MVDTAESEPIHFEQVCGACGDPSTEVNMDFRELEPINGIRRYEAVEPKKYGCSKHPTVSAFLHRAQEG